MEEVVIESDELRPGEDHPVPFRPSRGGQTLGLLGRQGSDIGQDKHVGGVERSRGNRDPDDLDAPGGRADADDRGRRGSRPRPNGCDDGSPSTGRISRESLPGRRPARLSPAVHRQDLGGGSCGPSLGTGQNSTRPSVRAISGAPPRSVCRHAPDCLAAGERAANRSLITAQRGRRPRRAVEDEAGAKRWRLPAPTSTIRRDPCSLWPADRRCRPTFLAQVSQDGELPGDSAQPRNSSTPEHRGRGVGGGQRQGHGGRNLVAPSSTQDHTRAGDELSPGQWSCGRMEAGSPPPTAPSEGRAPAL